MIAQDNANGVPHGNGTPPPSVVSGDAAGEQIVFALFLVDGAERLDAASFDADGAKVDQFVEVLHRFFLPNSRPE